MKRNKPIIVEKKMNGISIGFMVGWWFNASRYQWWDGHEKIESAPIFHNIRSDSIFYSKKDAEAFRDTIEASRHNNMGVVITEV